MQRKLPGLNCAIAGVLLLSLAAEGAVGESGSVTKSSKLRWISPSRITTPEDYQPPAKTTSKLKLSPSKSSNWKSTPKQSKPTAKSASKPSVSNKREPKKETSGDVAPKTTETDSESRSPNGNWIVVEDVDPETPTKEEPTSPDEDPRVAGRLFGRMRATAEQPQGPPPMETMHPTERQVDDRRRGTEPPVEDLPVPSREPEVTAEPEKKTELKPLTKSQQRMRTKVRRVLAHYYNRPLNTRDRSPWEIMHGILSYEVHSKVLRGGPNGKPVTAVGWLCFNQPCKKRTLMYVNDEGELRVRVGPALQGHRGQLLAMLAWSNVSRDYPMRVEGHDLTVADLVEMEKRTCYPRSELTFKLIGLMHYLPSDERWVNEQGREWNLPKIVYEESRQSLKDAACGGTHRLTGLTLAYKTREKRGEPVDGAYVRAKQYVSRHKNYAYRLQNGDGSFSTEWFRGPGNEESIDRKLKTTGHILEWLLFAAEERDLRSSRIHRAANYLTNIMYNNRNRDWEAGPLGHAIHALLLYDRMMFVPHDAADVLPMASTTKSGNQTTPKRSSTNQNRQASSGSTRR